MTADTHHVLELALQLPPAERAQLVERILASLAPPDRQAIDAAWAEEAEARLEAYRRGDIEVKPAEEVFEHVKRHLGR